MSKITFLTLILCVWSSTTSTQKFYRKDYTYNAKTDAFYKLHAEETTFKKAKQRCRAEGGYLMVPGPLDLVQGHALMKLVPELTAAFIGDDGEYAGEGADTALELNPEFETGPLSLEGSDCEVLNINGEVTTTHCFMSRPFICKVYTQHLVYNQQCGVYSTGYIYNSTTGSCYKVPSLPMTWYSAEAHCEGDDAHLAVINSAAEDQVLWDLARSAKVNGADTPHYYFIGFKTMELTSPVFRTVFNQTLQEAGFDIWAPNEPNNHAGTELCGSIFRSDGKLNDLHCDLHCAFICEKEIDARPALT